MDIQRTTTLLAQTLDVYGATKAVAYSLPLSHLAGDRILVNARAQVSSPYDYNVMVGFGVIHAATPTATAGHWIIRATAENVTPDIHHLVRVGSDWELPTYSYEGYANLILYAGASGARPGDTVRVDDYGSLSLAFFKSEVA